ncbi:MAG TPA: serine hydrolase domain-containing protein, partial [Longimicrobiaceae bacterium]|nr:serine hydrolase domain-containing protein [Longimicrobiaceae bacterium]
MLSIRRSNLLATAAALLVSASAVAAQTADFAGMDAYVAKAVRDWNVPGLAIAVVRGDSVVYARGFGVRRMGRPEAVDEHTLFAIGSTTKAFTATALAMLVDEGKVAWDDPVTKHVPGLMLYDPYVTRALTVRDLLTHHSGLPNFDALWYATDLPADELFRRLRFVKPTTGFRADYEYQNVMYALAGRVVANASGMPWDEFVRRRILTPLAMRETVTDMRALAAMRNVAIPHAEVDDTLRPIAPRDLENVAPAGAIYSSVSDMARWIRFQLDSTRVGGTRAVQAETFARMWTPQVTVPAAAYYPAARLANPHFIAYGLGWFLQDYRGREVWHHGGNVDGFTALVAMLPEERLGLVILTNMNGTALPTALMNKVWDLQLGAPARDWSG